MFAVDRISGQTGWHRRVSCSCLRSNIDMQLKVWVANLMAELRVVQSTDGFPMNIVIIVKDLTANISIYIVTTRSSADACRSHVLHAST